MKIAMIILALASAATYSFVALLFFRFQKRMEAEWPMEYRSPPWSHVLSASLWPVQVAYLVYWIFRMSSRL